MYWTHQVSHRQESEICVNNAASPEQWMSQGGHSKDISDDSYGDYHWSNISISYSV